MIGTKLAERYEILSELGRGGMGIVYRARDPVLSREVAIKLIPPAALSPEMEERFQREAQTVAQMDHPAIVPIYDLGSHDGSLFFVMPVVVGINLRQLLNEGSLVLGDVLEIGIQVAGALDYSHSRGIVHRDIKPENIMVEQEGATLRARVMDFGLARASSEDRLTKTGTLVGTVSYFSPEQITAHTFDGRSDTYSLGTVLYECVAGEPPFSGEMQAVLYRIVHQLPTPPRSMGADIREELEEIILGCLEKDPARRPQRAGLVAEALRLHRTKLQTDEYRRSVVLTASRVVSRPAAAAPFVGRQKEFAELQRRLNAAIAGECQFAVVAGEPGIGKTRLLEEIARLAQALDVRVLRGRFVEQDRVFAHQGFCEVIQDYFRSKDLASSPGEKPDFSDVAPDLLALFPVLGEIPELRSAATTGVRTDGTGEAFHAEDRTAIFELIARTLTRMAAGRPLLLILENLHGAEISIEALPYIVRRLGPTPTFIVGTYRQTEIDKRHPLSRMLDSFEDDPRFSAMTLGPFSASEHKVLVETIAGGAKISDSVAERLFDTTEGNPFFTKELVRSMIDTGGMARDKTGEWSFSHGAGISSDALPATIQQAIEKRIQRLPEETRGILSIASVLGKSFEYRDLETILDDPKDLEDAVDGLVREGILEEDRESRGDRIAFASAMVRDVLYGELSRRKRRSLHRKFAEILEARHAGRLERVYPELVHHFSEGDVPEKTVAYGLELARKSLEAFSPEEAIRAAKTALEYLQDEEWPGDRALEGEARVLLAHAHRLAGNTDGALAEAESAVKIFEREKQPEKAVSALLFAAESAWQERRIDETRRCVERGLDAARALDKAELRNRLLSLAVTVANLRGEYGRAAAYQAEIERLAPLEAAGEEAIPAGGTLVVAMSNPVAAAEPIQRQTVEDSEVIGVVFETLLSTDAQGTVAPLLAEAWQVSPDGTRVELTLRADSAFSDGAPLTATDVKAYVERNVAIRKSEAPAAFSAIRGVEDFFSGRAKEIAGIRAVSDRELQIELAEPLPIFPALLTDVAAAIGKVSDANRVLGTGPFRFASAGKDRIVLERNPHFRAGAAGRLDAIEFRTSMSASAIAAGLRSGEIDLARDLLPQDVEEIARDPRFRSGFVETPKKDTYFVLFNASTAAGGSEPLRRALAGSFRSQDLVWSTVGRFALPANGLLPPGILGHDAGRRRPHLSRENAAELIAASGLPLPIRLKASAHPILLDRYRSLTSSLLATWKDLGVEVEFGTSTMAEFLKSWTEPGNFDLMVGRWHADFEDPDNFTHTLFDTAGGLLKGYYSSPAADRLFEEARSEKNPSEREALYRKFESLLLDPAFLIPLFHDVDYRVAGPAVRGLSLRSRPPFVGYAEIGKAESATLAAAPAARPWAAGILHVPIPGSFPELDPALSETFEQAETLTMMFETLTRDVHGGQVVPWLASEYQAEEGGRRFRFRLRPGLRFHDGRRLTSRDVRFSFERLLQDSRSSVRHILSSVRGAEILTRGEASELEGFRIVSPAEFVLELERPIAFLPVLLSYPALAILPEGTGRVGTSWQDQCIGTGPFRAVGFEPGNRLELERNPFYWREGLPRSEGLVFHFGGTPEQIRDEFLAGRYSVASDLQPMDAEAFRQNPFYAPNYREVPRLTTYLVALNAHRGIFADPGRRKDLAGSLNAGEIVRRTLGRIAAPATGVIPPGLLGAESSAAPGGRKTATSTLSEQHTLIRKAVEITAVVHPIFYGEFSGFFDELSKAFRDVGFAIRRAHGDSMTDFLNAIARAEADLFIGRWNADYPDADTFVYNLLHSHAGLLRGFVSSPEIDRLAEQGRAELDPRVRHSTYRRVEELLAREARVLPLFYDRLYRFARPEIEGLVLGFGTPVMAYEELRIRA